MRLTRNFTERELNMITWPSFESSYTPISHSNVLDMLREEGDKNNLVLSNLKMIGNNSGTKLLGIMDVIGDDLNYGMRVAFRNSYDKSIPFGLALGAVVFICSNSVIAGEVNYRRKHVGDAITDTKEYISEGLKYIKETYIKSIKDADRLSGIGITAPVAYELIGKMFIEEEIINSMQLNIVKDQLLNSQNFTPITAHNFTAWDLYNAVTESLKKSHPATYIADHANLHQLMLTEFA